MDTYCRNKQTAFWNGMLEADHGRHAKRPYQNRGHDDQPWHYRGYIIMAGNKTTIFRSCGQNGPTPSAKHCEYGRVEGKRVKGRPSKRWLDNVTDDCYHRRWSIVEATRLATDRQRWRTYIRLPQRAPYFMDVYGWMFIVHQFFRWMRG